MCLAIPGKIVNISADADETSRPGTVSFGGILKDVNLCFLPEACVGDYVLIHVGVALSVIDEEQARETLNYLRQMGELDELEPEPGPYSGTDPAAGTCKDTGPASDVYAGTNADADGATDPDTTGTDAYPVDDSNATGTAASADSDAGNSADFDTISDKGLR